MKRLYFLPVIALVLACQEPTGATAHLTRVSSIESDTLDIQEWWRLSQNTTTDTVTIAFDHFFKREKQYRVFPLEDLLQNRLDTAGKVLTFLCKDGYKPSMSFAKALAKRGFVAIKDLDAAPDKAWIDTLHEEFSPYYLVWENIPYEDHSMPWPFGLTHIIISSKEKELSAIYPSGNPKVLAGFHLYKENCYKCHSINKSGGDMGPEFNYPKNITEYWSKEHIWQFIQSPRSFRYNSKMPEIHSLDQDEFEKLYDYLVYIKQHKLPQ